MLEGPGDSMANNIMLLNWLKLLLVPYFREDVFVDVVPIERM